MAKFSYEEVDEADRILREYQQGKRWLLRSDLSKSLNIMLDHNLERYDTLKNSREDNKFLASEVKELKKKVSELREQVAQLLNEKELLTEVRKGLEKDLETCLGSLAKAEEEYLGRVEQYNGLTKNLENVMAARNEMEQKNFVLNETVNKIRKLLENL